MNLHDLQLQFALSTDLVEALSLALQHQYNLTRANDA